MTEDNAESQKREEARHRGYQDIGEFMVEFSQLEFSVRWVLGAQLKLPAEVLDPVTAPYDFAVLCRLAQYVLTFMQPKQEGEIREIFGDCLKLNDQRVRVAHGLWGLGEDTVVASHISRNSLKVGIYFEKPGDLKALAKEAQRLRLAVWAIGGNAFAFYAEKSLGTR